MITNKIVGPLIVFLLLPFFNIKATTNDIYIKSHIGILRPTSTLLNNYYSREIIFLYGAEFTYYFNKYGLYFNFINYSFDVQEDYFVEKIKTTWFTIGLEKIFLANKYSNLYGRLGGTLHVDDLAISESNLSRIGIQPGFGGNIYINNTLIFFIEFNYEYELLKIPIYVTTNYSRHNEFLSGKSFQTGGAIFKIGLSYSLHKN